MPLKDGHRGAPLRETHTTGLVGGDNARMVGNIEHAPVALWTADALRRESKGQEWLEFLRVRAMSGGIYVLEAGAAGLQTPHTEDEVYVVLSGHCRFAANEQVLEVGPGDTLFVAANLEHRFIDIDERVEFLVFFAPAEGTVSVQ